MWLGKNNQYVVSGGAVVIVDTLSYFLLSLNGWVYMHGRQSGWAIAVRVHLRRVSLDWYGQLWLCVGSELTDSVFTGAWQG